MNLAEFHTLIRALEDDVKTTDVLNRLSELVAALERVVASPAEGSYQQQLSQTRDALLSALSSSPSKFFTPRRRTLVEEELHASDLLADRLIDLVKEIFSENQITPQTALDSLRILQDRVAGYTSALTSANSALQFFDADTDDLAPGEYEAAIGIPRDEVSNSLGELGREFVELDRILQPFVEAATGSRPPIEVKAIASSNFEAFVELVPQAAVLLSIAVDRVLVAYERVLNIRKLRAELRTSGVEDDDLERVDRRANSMVDDAIPRIVADVMAAAQDMGTDGRRNEIAIELTKAVRSITRKVDHGLRITVRTEPLPVDDAVPDDGSNPPDAALLERINREVLQNQVRATFQELPGEPILELEPRPLSVEGEGSQDPPN
jgi:hypothetical protein